MGGINSQLKSMTDNLLGGGRITYGYDEFSNLVSAKHDGFSERIADIFRTADDVGNIYETQGKTDRTYTQGSRMTQANQHKQEYLDFSRNKINDRTDFAYDDEGNLIRKATHDGRIWLYQYYGNGMLAKVTHTAPRQEAIETSFKYDSLGRRVEKSTIVGSVENENTPNTATSAKTTTFIWDGNNPIHEIRNEETTTWVFNDGFVPVAKVTKDNHYSIITDYLGTPVEAYDREGDKVWSAELDIYGRVKIDRNNAPGGDIDFIPFRYQGQYHDTETGLYYNRFRYYDPTTGNYIQQDPIGLQGGNPTLYAYAGNANWWIDPFGLQSNSALLSSNLGQAPGLNFAAHHIVMTGTQNANMNSLVAQMNVHGIAIDGAQNGIWLPRKDVHKIPGFADTSHQQDGLHGQSYKDEIFNRLNGKNKDEFIKELAKIKKELHGGRTWGTETTKRLKKPCR